MTDVVAEVEPVAAAPAAARARRYRRLLVEHRIFVVVLLVAAALRVVTMLAVRPVELYWYDSYSYLSFALHPSPPRELHPGGYGMLLWLLRPFHSLALVAAVQHVMGLAVGVLIYAVSRRRSVPVWAALLATVPALFDVRLLHLEHAVFSDTMFMLLIVAAVTVLLWSPTVSVRSGVVAGLLLAMATLTRTVGLPVLLLVLAWFVVRRVGLRPLLAATAAAALPLALYSGWYASEYGRFTMTGGDGVSLWARTMTFADCSVMRPPPREARLCPNGIRQPVASEYMWAPDSPINRMRGGHKNDDLARSFAVRAIRTQPLDYLSDVTGDVALAFRWPLAVHIPRIPPVYYFHEGRTLLSDQPGARKTIAAYDPGTRDIHTVRPYTGVLLAYQAPAYVPGPLLAALFLVGALGVLRRRPMLPWAVAVTLLVVPVAVSDFDHRYVLPVVPVVCLAAALALARKPAS